MVLTLREALKSLCSSNGWSYAVFWRLKSPNGMILTWEDGHYESTKPAGISNISTFTAPGSFVKNWESGGDLLDYGIRSQDGCSMQDQIKLLVSKMSQQMHSLQEGIVGSIASSGKHQWIIMENLLREWSSLGPLNPCSSFEYPDGWQTQLAAGIKTIAFIAAAPYGVVQLGSKQTIIEDLELVTRVKNLFGSVYNLSRPDSQDSVQELLSGRIHGTRFLPGNRSGIVLHGIPKQSMLKNSSLNVSEQGGDSFSLLATSKGIPACSSSSFAKSISQFSQLQQKAMQLSGFTSSHNNDHETLLKESRILPSARVIYPLQGMLQASTCEAGNRQSLFNCSRTKELGLQGQRPVLSINGQSPVNTKAQEVSFQSVWLDMGPPLTSPLEQTEIPSSVPALQDVLAQTECSISSSAPVVNANQLEQMGRKVEHLAGLDSSHPSYKDPTHSSATIQASLSAVMDRCCTSWGMTSGQHGTALQETVGNHVMPPSLGDDFISAAFGIGSHSWDKDLTAKDVSPLFQDVMVDDLYPGNENFKDLEVPFGEVTTVTDECAPGFDDAKFLTKGQENCTNSIVLPAVDELFDVLHPAFKKCKTQDQVIWDDILLPVSNGSNANFISHSVGIPASLQCPSRGDILHSFDASMDRGFEGGFYSDRKSENLLDAVVANIRPPVNHSTKETALSNITFSGLNGATSLHSPSVKTNSCLSGTLNGSDKSKYVGLSRCGDNTGLNTIQSFFKSGFQGETSSKSTSNNTSLKSQLSSWIEDSKSSKGGNLGLSQAKKPDEPVKVNRKRAKPGESTRPRPKDRQQIQDRVKELREIVPNGSKCSIDALLERTIKHMLFLQSVTKHADKLKHNGEQKGFYKDLSLGKDNVEGGASWALEVAGQSMGCPIIVENMSQPRQMLVEMLCEERGLFLEIADIIRGLGLTILKGVMEARKDKIWARFAVEANRDVHRVEILWSLMQLLQQNTKEHYEC